MHRTSKITAISEYNTKQKSVFFVFIVERKDSNLFAWLVQELPAKRKVD